MDSQSEVSSRGPTLWKRILRFVPAVKWLIYYDRKFLPGDALAGIIVATLLIPQAMAYALLAGLPPQVGIYAGMLPLAVYALLGSSQYLSVGPSALTCQFAPETVPLIGASNGTRG